MREAIRISATNVREVSSVSKHKLEETPVVEGGDSNKGQRHRYKVVYDSEADQRWIFFRCDCGASISMERIMWFNLVVRQDDCLTKREFDERMSMCRRG